MIKKDSLVLIFRNFETEHLGKDVFCVPYYLGKQYRKNTCIVYPLTSTNKHFKEEYRGVKFNPIKSYGHHSIFVLKSTIWMLLNIVHIDILMQFHFSIDTLLFGLIYKLLRPKGFLYIKCDGLFWLDDILAKLRKNTLKYLLYKKLLKKVNCISIELEKGLQQLCSNKYCGISLKDKAVLVRNGFDEETLFPQCSKILPYSDKDNIILSIGRIGTYQKNTEMLLNAISNININNWKLIIIGTIKDDFRKKIECYFENYPDKRKSLLFTGPIYDKRVLYDYYNRSRIFLLTSRWEGSPIVFSEAIRFNNYLISTDFDAAKDYITDSSKGLMIRNNDYSDLSEKLNSIINGDIKIQDPKMIPIFWEKEIQKIILL